MNHDDYSMMGLNLAMGDDLSQEGYQPIPMDDDCISPELFQAMLDALPNTLLPEPVPLYFIDPNIPYLSQPLGTPPTSSSNHYPSPEFSSAMLFTETPFHTDTEITTLSSDCQNFDFFSTESSTSPSIGTLSAGPDFNMSSESSPSFRSLPPDMSEFSLNTDHPMAPVKKKTNNRPCDLKRERRKIDKPERCKLCPGKSSWNRDLKRHMVAKHKPEAKAQGIPVGRTRCSSCLKTFARKDHLTRHLKASCKGSNSLSLK